MPLIKRGWILETAFKKRNQLLLNKEMPLQNDESHVSWWKELEQMYKRLYVNRHRREKRGRVSFRE